MLLLQSRPASAAALEVGGRARETGSCLPPEMSASRRPWGPRLRATRPSPPGPHANNPPKRGETYRRRGLLPRGRNPDTCPSHHQVARERRALARFPCPGVLHLTRLRPLMVSTSSRRTRKGTQSPSGPGSRGESQAVLILLMTGPQEPRTRGRTPNTRLRPTLPQERSEPWTEPWAHVPTGGGDRDSGYHSGVDSTHAFSPGLFFSFSSF